MSAFEKALQPKLIDVVRQNVVDRRNVPAETGAVPFFLCVQDFEAGLTPSGVIIPAVLAELQAYVLAQRSPTFELHRRATAADGPVVCVAFADSIAALGRVGMTGVMAALLQYWRERGIFTEYLKKREPFPVFADPKSNALTPPSPSCQNAPQNWAFSMDREVTALFRIAYQTCDLIAFEWLTRDNGEKEMGIWVQRRGLNRKNALCLDTTVAGGLPAGLSPVDNTIKEAEEEAMFPTEWLAKRIRQFDVITDLNYLEDIPNPFITWAFEVELPPRDAPDYLPPRIDHGLGEVAEFILMSPEEVLSTIRSGEMTYNCALVHISFLMKYGYNTCDNEPDYLEIVWRCHQQLHVAIPALTPQKPSAAAGVEMTQITATPFSRL